jgi:formylglycine-generating enzyme
VQSSCQRRVVYWLSIALGLCHLMACATMLNLDEATPGPSSCERDAQCPPTQVCDAESQKCVAACQSGARHCDGVSERVCDDEGHWSARACSDGCQAGYCRQSKSCDLRPVCGDDEVSCCQVTAVAGGSFGLPNDPTSGPGFAPVERAVTAFGLDRFEVTIGRFRRFIRNYDDSGIPDAGAGALPELVGSGWRDDWGPDTGEVPSSAAAVEKLLNNCKQVTDGTIPEDMAVGCVSWYLANAFCIWEGGRLPTEAEWSFAAMGGQEQRIYPWSAADLDDSIDDAYAVYLADGADELTAPAAVGHKPDGRGKFDNEDLSGNVWEWVADVYRSPLRKGPCRADHTGDAALRDCMELDGTGERVVKGGGYDSRATELRNVTRLGVEPKVRVRDIGFRCAWNLESKPKD